MPYYMKSPTVQVQWTIC